jgi:hypothetical protein
MEDISKEPRTVAHTIKIKPAVNKALTLELIHENDGIGRKARKSMAVKIAEILEERHLLKHPGKPKRALAAKRK